jgi:four helix bundle protein
MDLKRFKLIELADAIGEQVWNEVSNWSSFERDTIGKQWVRAADSISANLSEAYGRYSFPDRRRFSLYARGSLCETMNWMDKASRRKLIEQGTGMKLNSDLTNLSFKINYYIKSISNLSRDKS